MKLSEFDELAHALVKRLVPVVREHVEREIAELKTQIAALAAGQIKSHVKVLYDGERRITVCWKDGTPIDDGGEIVLPVVIDRGVYVRGKQYARGDAVTDHGSWWIAQEATDGRPKESRAWRLARKEGSP